MVWRLAFRPPQWYGLDRREGGRGRWSLHKPYRVERAPVFINLNLYTTPFEALYFVTLNLP